MSKEKCHDIRKNLVRYPSGEDAVKRAEKTWRGERVVVLHIEQGDPDHTGGG